MVDQLTQDQIHNFREAFNFIDTDRDGIISISDLSAVMKMLHQPFDDAHLADMIKQGDNSGNGHIFFHDFLELLSTHINETPNDEQDIIDCLQALDENGNGVIKVEKLRSVMSKLMEHLTEDDLNQMIQKSNIDSEGYVDYRDFVKKMLANSSDTAEEKEN